MPCPEPPPPLPPDLVDELVSGLERVAALADLLACAPSGRLLDGTVATAGDLIGGEATRLLAVVRQSNLIPASISNH